MSLFRYKVVLADGKEKSSRVTAKNEAAARIRVADLNQVKEWIWIREEKPAALKPKVAAPPATKPAAVKSRSKLEKLLYLQSNKCFFCRQALLKDDASIEHLQPKSAGGTNEDGNVVVCCKKLNQFFGNMSLKRKIEVILAKAELFKCPAEHEAGVRPT